MLVNPYIKSLLTTYNSIIFLYIFKIVLKEQKIRIRRNHFYLHKLKKKVL